MVTDHTPSSSFVIGPIALGNTARTIVQDSGFQVQPLYTNSAQKSGTVIGETAAIGAHVKLYQGVGLVARSLSGGQSLKGQKRHPTLEDHVTIYANATIVGGETVIGSGSTIGASVFLTQSVPPNSLVTYEKTDIKVTRKQDRAKTDFQI